MEYLEINIFPFGIFKNQHVPKRNEYKYIQCILYTRVGKNARLREQRSGKLRPGPKGGRRASVMFPLYRTASDFHVIFRRAPLTVFVVTWAELGGDLGHEIFDHKKPLK